MKPWGAFEATTGPEVDRERGARTREDKSEEQSKARKGWNKLLLDLARYVFDNKQYRDKGNG